VGLERSQFRSRLEAKIEGLGLGEIWEGLVSVSKAKISFTSLVTTSLYIIMMPNQ